MSTISRTGNLAKTPTLREGKKGPYTFATVMVTDRVRQEDGSYTDGPSTAYEVAVSGDQATRLVATAERDGNVRITFTGRYRVTEWQGDKGTRIQHEVQADDIGLSFRGQDVGVIKDAARADAAPEKPAEETGADADESDEPADIFAEGTKE